MKSSFELMVICMLSNSAKISMYTKYNLSYEPKFSVFHDLMTKRIQEILLVSTLYDNFILEEDIRLSEKLFELYNKLNLSAPPRMTRVSSPKEALELIDSGEKTFEFIITMRRLADMNPFEFGQNVKKRLKDVPIVLLLNNPIDLRHLPPFQRNLGIDRIFLWTGDSELLLAIIKYFEDLLNVDHDIEVGQIQIILLVENSVKWYSTYLPMLFSEVMKQTQILIEEGLNDYHRLLRMRARPKILLAENYEEAMEIFGKYKHYILGVFSDVAFERNGKLDQESGKDFIKEVKKFNDLLPTLLLSSNEENWRKAKELKSAFIYKYSPTAKINISNFLLKNLGFGDFVFRLKDGIEVGRAKNIPELINLIQIVPDESLIFHASNNHFSAFLMARGEITLAYKLRPMKITEFKDMPTFRLWMSDILHEALQSEQRGVIVEFSEKINRSNEVIFQRIGSGSLGGKGRGLAFLNTLITLGEFTKSFPDIKIAVPLTLVLCTDEFDKFIQNNNLYKILSENYTDNEIVSKFLDGNFSSNIVKNLLLFLDYHKFPIAVSSSSLL